jgi:predicted nucleic acid-binding protein
MALYNPMGKSGKLIKAAIENHIELFSPDSVKEEIKRLVIQRLDFDEVETNNIIEALPTKWIHKELYDDFMGSAKILPHASDRPILATALLLGCGIITANRKHFLPAQRMVKVWDIDELLAETEKPGR